MKTTLETIWKTAAVTLAILVAMAVAESLLLSGLDVGWEKPPGPAELLPPVLFAMLLNVAVLIYPVRRSTLRGWRLGLAIFVAVFGINVVLTQTEGALFLKLSPSFLVAGWLRGTLQAALLALLMVAAFGRGEQPVRTEPADGPRFGAGGWLGRVALCSVSYAFLYAFAGLLIIPYVLAFYETQQMPPAEWILPNGLLRGALYVAFALPLLRSLVGGRWRVALATAALFPILAGAASLLIPNPVMPDWVRPFHAVEIAWSNFVFGLLVGYLFWNPRAGVQAERRTEPESLLPKAA